MYAYTHYTCAGPQRKKKSTFYNKSLGKHERDFGTCTNNFIRTLSIILIQTTVAYDSVPYCEGHKNIANIRRLLYAFAVPIYTNKSVLNTYHVFNAHGCSLSKITCLVLWLKFSLCSTAYVSEQHRFWRDCANTQARLNLCCSYML